MYQTIPWGQSVLNDGMKDDDKKFILLGRLQFPRFLYIQTLVTKGFSPIPMIKTSTWLPTRDFGSFPVVYVVVVTELSFGLYGVHWEFSSSTREDGGFKSPFVIDLIETVHPISIFFSSLHNCTCFRKLVSFELLSPGRRCQRYCKHLFFCPM
jgi:hypothetical protein